MRVLPGYRGMKAATLAMTACFSFSGCGAILRGTHQQVGLAVNPVGTEVSFYRMNGEHLAGPVRSPGDIQVHRPSSEGYEYLIVMSREGYCPKYMVTTAHPDIGMIILDVLAGGVLPGVIVDGVIGGAQSIEPDPIRASLAEEGSCAQ